MFDLQIVDPVPGLEALGAQVQLRELSYGALREAMGAATGAARASDALLAAALFVDGAPIGLETLDALPGRFAGPIARAMERCLELHGMTQRVKVEAANDEGKNEADGASAEGEL